MKTYGFVWSIHSLFHSLRYTTLGVGPGQRTIVTTLLRSDHEDGYERQQYYCEFDQAKHRFLTTEYKAQWSVGAVAGSLPSHWDKRHGWSAE
jgi:hypothetical protein